MLSRLYPCIFGIVGDQCLCLKLKLYEPNMWSAIATMSQNQKIQSQKNKDCKKMQTFSKEPQIRCERENNSGAPEIRLKMYTIHSLSIWRTESPFWMTHISQNQPRHRCYSWVLSQNPTESEQNKNYYPQTVIACTPNNVNNMSNVNNSKEIIASKNTRKQKTVVITWKNCTWCVDAALQVFDRTNNKFSAVCDF